MTARNNSRAEPKILEIPLLDKRGTSAHHSRLNSLRYTTRACIAPYLCFTSLPENSDSRSAAFLALNPIKRPATGLVVKWTYPDCSHLRRTHSRLHIWWTLHSSLSSWASVIIKQCSTGIRSGWLKIWKVSEYFSTLHAVNGYTTF